MVFKRQEQIMTIRNIFYAQSGGPTAVINATACGLIQTARAHKDKIGTVFAGKNGILGALTENLIDTSLESDEAIASLMHTPGSIFGSCRYKLKPIEENKKEYKRLIDVFTAHNIGYFFYNGGNDSQDTALKVSGLSDKLGYPITCIGLPKTIDNDLPFTDTCPGFGSAAKYIATSIMEASIDLKGMAASSTKVFALEVMGRDAGWIAASGGLACRDHGDPPHIILLPEVPFQPGKFIAKVEETVRQYGFCSMVVSEGIRYRNGKFLANADMHDAFGNIRLGGAAPVVSHLIHRELGFKYHWAVADYLQRSARHMASKTDLDQAYAIGVSAVEFALAEKNNIMLIIERNNTSPYQWSIGQVPLSDVVNQEHKVPDHFIAEDDMHITDACRQHLLPLIQGEAFPPFQEGLPAFGQLKNQLVPKRLDRKT